MAHKSDLIAEDIEGYLRAHETKSLLRFITCGSVDDGKSTLIGRLLYESKLVFEDHLAALEADSKKVGTQGDQLDFALLVDGLAAEREQGITIDVAYRFFSTEYRKFIVADTPGHEQYTRNMATGASTADLAVLMIDARKGVLTQTRRHSYIVNLLGVRHLVLAVNKMDLVDYSKDRFDEIVEDYLAFADQIGISRDRIVSIPMSALAGDNITERSATMDWYFGATLMAHLESVEIDRDDETLPFRMPVQWVNRPNLDFRGFSGLVGSGTIRVGDDIRALPSGKTSTVKRIVLPGRPGEESDLKEAVAHQSVTLTLSDEIDISRGDVICAASEPAEVADQFRATLLWMDGDDMLPGRTYLMKTGAKTVQATVAAPRHVIDVNSLEKLAAKTMTLNAIGSCNLALDQAIAFDPYGDNRYMGSFILIDRMTNRTVAMGFLKFALRRASNIHRQALDVNEAARAEQKGQRPVVLWFTGLSGSGKSTIANALEKRLFAMGRHTMILDGDNVRHGLNRDLGFTEADRVENIRRVAEVSGLMVEAGLITLVSFISPFRSERDMARERIGDGQFFEIYVNTPLAVAEDRDVKGLYKKARAGEIKNFTGIDSPYEPPENPEIVIDTVDQSPEEAAEQIIAILKDQGVLPE
ncbi:MAG: sulfate adenylyltransferase subunit CysN [Pseudomonadota bacterium]